MFLASLVLLAGPLLHEGAWQGLPMARVNGLASVGGSYVLGGLDGLFIGKPGDWKSVSKEPVRQIVSQGEAAWVLFGSGAVDKIEPLTDRRYPDVFFGAARRPWCSCLFATANKLFAGTTGGWIEKGPRGLAEHYPPALKGQIVTAVLPQGDAVWVGTQAGALFRFSGANVHRWTPAHGLMDSWVSSLAATPKGVFVGTYTAGLYRIKGSRAIKLPTPGERVRSLIVFRNRIALGLDQSAYLQDSGGWKPLQSPDKETTGFCVVNGKLTVLTNLGVQQ